MALRAPIKQVQAPTEWIQKNKFVNENGLPFEFDDHKFLIKILNDFHPDIVTAKSAQCGESVGQIFKSFYSLDTLGWNIAHVLPTENVVDGFVVPKVNPILTLNPKLAEILESNARSQKKISGRFVYYRGAFSEAQAISITTDKNLYDEYDRSDQKIVQMYNSRYQYSAIGHRERFSNPSAEGFGVDDLYKKSDQMHWFIKCHHCSFRTFIDFAQDMDTGRANHYFNLEEVFFACGKCHKPLSDEDRRQGEWVAKFPTRTHLRGYWISQLMVPWVQPRKIKNDYEESSPEYFHNFVLGKAYSVTDMVVDRKAILNANSPGEVSYNNVGMGVDNGNLKHYIIGNTEGIFKYGVTKDWSEIENLALRYNAQQVVMDSNPYPVEPRKLALKHPGRFHPHWYIEDKKDLGITVWKKDGGVTSDRTKLLDQVATEINDQTIMYRFIPMELEPYISHWNGMYRTTIIDSKNRPKPAWVTKGGEPDHWAHATAYWRVAMEKVGSLGGYGVRTHKPQNKIPIASTVSVKDGTMSVSHDLDPDELVAEAMRATRKRKY